MIPKALRLRLVGLTLARLILTTGLRLTYPFLPELARGLGVSLQAAAQLVTVRNLAGFLGPLFGPLSDRFGRRPLMAAALLLAAAGSSIVLLWPAYWPLGITLAAIALAKVIYDPAMQAYLGDTVPYEQRGRALAVTEWSWAGALLVGAPLVGLVIQRQGWMTPFLWLGLLALIFAFFIWRILPAADGRSTGRINLAGIWRLAKSEPVIWAAMSYIFFIMAANEMILIVYGDWMETSFGLNLANLGLAAAVIGGAELAGESVAGWTADRFGKRPVIITAALATTLAYALIPYTSSSRLSALVSVYLLFLAFEITVVAGIPLMTELVPGARGLVLSFIGAASALGRALGSFAGPQIWLAAGLPGSGLAAALLMLAGSLILIRWVRESKNPWQAAPSHDL